MELLRSLDTADWSRSTLARQWQVQDIVAHLLDGSLRTISLYRDKLELPPAAISTYSELVGHLNKLNGEWVTAMRRISPPILMEWMETTHESYVQCLEQLDPLAPAKYSVAWAGAPTSPNWFHVAREYTEKWHHQQQIREATGKQGILSRMFYFPTLDTFFMALPHSYRNCDAPVGTHVAVHVDTDAGGTWIIERRAQQWMLTNESTTAPSANIQLPASLAWKLLTKGVSYEEVRDRILLDGPDALTMPALRTISVMA